MGRAQGNASPRHLPSPIPQCYGHAAPVLSPWWQLVAGWDAVRGLTCGRALREPSTRLQTLVGASVRRAVTLTSLGGVPGVIASSLCSPSWAGGCNETRDIEVGRGGLRAPGMHTGQGDPAVGLRVDDFRSLPIQPILCSSSVRCLRASLWGKKEGCDGVRVLGQADRTAEKGSLAAPEN